MNQFELFLNRMRGGNMPSVDMPTPQEPKQPDFRVPSQMPGAYNMGVGMGPGIDHGITGNLSDIQNRPFDYGMKGGLKQMPYSYGDQGGIQQIIKQKIPAITLDGGKTYFDPRDGSPLDFNKLGLKDFLITP